MTDPVMLLSQLHGEGRVTFRAVRAAGFYTLSSIADSPVQSLADRAHLSARTARRLKSGAEEMIGKGIGLDSPDNETAAKAAAGRAGQSGRRGRRGRSSSRPAGFSEGVLLEEAALLGQGVAALTCEPLEEPEACELPESAQLPDSALQSNPAAPSNPTKPGGPDVGRRIAEAAEAAAGLTRQLSPAAAPLEPEPETAARLPHRTFWGFG
jgi:hypothetical protein